MSIKNFAGLFVKAFQSKYGTGFVITDGSSTKRVTRDHEGNEKIIEDMNGLDFLSQQKKLVMAVLCSDSEHGIALRRSYLDNLQSSDPNTYNKAMEIFALLAKTPTTNPVPTVPTANPVPAGSVTWQSRPYNPARTVHHNGGTYHYIPAVGEFWLVEYEYNGKPHHVKKAMPNIQTVLGPVNNGPIPPPADPVPTVNPEPTQTAPVPTVPTPDLSTLMAQMMEMNMRVMQALASK